MCKPKKTNKSGTAQANTNQSSAVQFKSTKPWVIFSLMSSTSRQATVDEIKAVLLDIAGPICAGSTDPQERKRIELLQDENGGLLATYAGFSISGGTSVFNENDIDLPRLTYHIAFRTPFQTMKDGKNNADLFDTVNTDQNGNWFQQANEIRVTNWQNNHYLPIVKRLNLNGEEEIYPVQQNSPPVPNATDPAMYQYANNTRSRYEHFGVKLNLKLDEHYFDSVIDTPPLEHYLVNCQETPYFDAFLQLYSSIPFVLGAPFAKAATPQTFDITINESTTHFYSPNDTNSFRSSTKFRFAKVISYTIDAPNSRVIISILGYKREDAHFALQNSNVSLSDGDKIGLVDDQYDGSTAEGVYKRRMLGTGELYFRLNAHPSDRTNILKDISNPTQSFIPDYENGELLYDNKIFNDITGFYIHVLRPHTYTANIPQATLTANGLSETDLLGCWVYEKTAGEFVLEYTNSSSVISTSYTNGITALSGSGFSTAYGIDLGVGVFNGNIATRVYRSPAKHSDDMASTFDDYLRGTCPNWNDTNMFGALIDPVNPVVSDQRQTVFGILGKRGFDAAAYYIQHRGIFSLIDFAYPFNVGRFRSALITVGGLMDDNYSIANYTATYNYYGFGGTNAPILNQLIKAGLKAVPNVVEKYAMLGPQWNLGHLNGAKDFAKAINKHDLNLLKAAWTTHMSPSVHDNNIRNTINGYLNSDAVINYFQNEHFN